jgi:hypothetical protein
MRIFLSHAIADAAISKEIEARLHRLGVSVYLAEHDNQAGSVLADKVTDALLDCDLVIALLTPAGYSSRFVHQEIGAARTAGKLVVPLVDITIPAFDLGMLNGVEYIGLDPASPARALETLGERVVGLARAHADRAAVAAIAAATVSAERRQAELDTLLALLAVAAVLTAAGAYLYYNGRG